MGVKRNQWFFKNVGRHFVTLSYVVILPGKTDAEQKCAVISGFVVEILDTWYYVTAGHVIDEIRELEGKGARFDRWRLDDQTAGNSFKGLAIPYDFDVNQWLVLRKDEIGLDYAVIPLTGLTREALKAGGVEPIPRNAWGELRDDYDQWILVGVPAETVVHQGNIIKLKPVMVPLQPVLAPTLAGKTVDNMFFGKLNFESPDPLKVTDIRGMSGGPIFATKSADAVLKYWVLGVQSGWYESDSIVSACPFSTFGMALEDLLKKLEATT